MVDNDDGLRLSQCQEVLEPQYTANFNINTFYQFFSIFLCCFMFTAILPAVYLMKVYEVIVLCLKFFISIKPDLYDL